MVIVNIMSCLHIHEHTHSACTCIDTDTNIHKHKHKHAHTHTPHLSAVQLPKPVVPLLQLLSQWSERKCGLAC